MITWRAYSQKWREPWCDMSRILPTQNIWFPPNPPWYTNTASTLFHTIPHYSTLFHIPLISRVSRRVWESLNLCECFPVESYQKYYLTNTFPSNLSRKNILMDTFQTNLCEEAAWRILLQWIFSQNIHWIFTEYSLYIHWTFIFPRGGS